MWESLKVHVSSKDIFSDPRGCSNVLHDGYIEGQTAMS